MHIEVQEKGVHIHIQIDERLYPELKVQELYRESEETLKRLQERYTVEPDKKSQSKSEEVIPPGQYL